MIKLQNNNLQSGNKKVGGLTRANLETAFEKEAIAYVRYRAMEENAKKQGYADIARCFSKAAENELAHALVWLNETESGGSINTDLENSIRGENESIGFYINCAVDAENEGYDSLKERFLNANAVEKKHMETFTDIYERYKGEELFVSENECFWECENCGHIHKGVSPPAECPLCARGETYFTRLTD
jgi:rubrerythrin